jgi:hypothetical protein
MLFFKRILNFDKQEVAKRDLRHALRYTVEPNTPLRTSLRMGNHDQPVTLLNLSSNGAAIQLSEPADYHRGEVCRLRLVLGRHALRLDVTVAHQLTETGRTMLGLEFKFANFEEQTNYLQLLEPVVIGASLKPCNPKLVRQKEAGLLTKFYVGPDDTLLTVWRKFAGQAVHSFEFRMHNYFVRSSSTPHVLEIYTCDELVPGQKQGYGMPELTRATKQSAEIRQLFLWVVPHLNQAVPDDIREFLAEFCD